MTDGRNGIDLAIEQMVKLVDSLLGKLNQGDTAQFVRSEAEYLRTVRANCASVIDELDMTEPDLANEVRNLRLLLGRLLTVAYEDSQHVTARVMEMYEPAIKEIRNDLRARLNRSEEQPNTEDDS